LILPCLRERVYWSSIPRVNAETRLNMQIYRSYTKPTVEITSQSSVLQELYKTYGGDHFTVIGFPSNDFGGQEPGTNAEIATFCQQNYGVTFPIMDKIVIKGDDVNPVYSWLTHQSENGVSDAEVKWNFNKFLIDENGNWVAYFGSKVLPLDEKIVKFAKGE